MNWDLAYKTIIPLVVMGSIGYLALRDESRPDILAKLAGCYRSVGPVRPIELRVDAARRLLIARDDETVVEGREIKGRYALLPEKKMVFDHHDRSRVEFDTATPLIITASHDRRELIAIDDVGRSSVPFQRVRCSV